MEDSKEERGFAQRNSKNVKEKCPTIARSLYNIGQSV